MDRASLIRSTEINPAIPDQEEEEISFPKSHFVPVKIGEFRGVSHLEKLIDLLNIKSNKYIIHTKVSLVGAPELHNSTLLLASDYFYFIPDEEKEDTQVTYAYLEIEKCHTLHEEHKIKLQFYKTAKSDKEPPIVCK